MTENKLDITLIPCKICGNKPVLGGALFMGHHVECQHCGIAMPFPPMPSQAEAAIAWNEEQQE